MNQFARPDWASMSIGERIRHLEVEGYFIWPDALSDDYVNALKLQTSRFQTRLDEGHEVRHDLQWEGGAITDLIGHMRLTNAFSKKAEMLAYSIAITFFYHNFVRVHQTLKTTPAVAAGVAKHKWRIEDIVDLLPLEIAGKRGSYKKRISN
jgi:hypothetical protein